MKWLFSKKPGKMLTYRVTQRTVPTLYLIISCTEFENIQFWNSKWNSNSKLTKLSQNPKKERNIHQEWKIYSECSLIKQLCWCSCNTHVFNIWKDHLLVQYWSFWDQNSIWWVQNGSKLSTWTFSNKSVAKEI